MKQCPFCTAENENLVDKCEYCGRDLPTENQKTCPSCGKIIPIIAIKCKYCDHKFYESVQNTDVGKEPKKQGNYSSFVLIIFILIMIGIYFAITSGGSPSSSRSESYQVTYEVTGTALGVSVTYNNSQGGTEQGEYNVPFKKTFSMKYGDFMYISAQNSYDRGSVICKIYIDGEEVKSSTSNGAYVIASCSGSVRD
jgi:hypothetical protein